MLVALPAPLAGVEVEEEPLRALVNCAVPVAVPLAPAPDEVAAIVDEVVVTLTRFGFWAPQGWDVVQVVWQAVSPLGQWSIHC